MQVAVIGAGAAGLCAARHLAQQSNRTVPCVFEQTGTVGGTWVYNQQTGKDEWGEHIHSSMYKNLKTNLPKEVMAFPDFPFNSNQESFIHHSKVREYLESYCQHFNLQKFIKFHTKIETVKPSADASKKYWEVQYRCIKTNNITNAFFDGILVCNGHYSSPRYPHIPDLDKFSGSVVHSHDYRDPLDYSGESLVVLGAAASGTDIAIEVSAAANQVYLSHNGPFLQSKLPANVAQIRGLDRCIGTNSFSLTDGSRVQCDAVILATGYEYKFPFLSSGCGLSVVNNQVQPLFKHFLNIEHPSMALIGLPLHVVPFPQFDLQIQYFLKLLVGDSKLPIKDEMYADTAKEKEFRMNKLEMREKDFHKMGDLQWDYNNEITRLAAIPPIKPVVQKLYKEVWHRRKVGLTSYKADAFKIKDNEEFVEIQKEA